MERDGQKPTKKYKIYQVMNVRKKANLVKMQGVLKGDILDTVIRKVLSDSS